MPTPVAYNSGNYGLANGTSITGGSGGNSGSNSNTRFDAVNLGSGGTVTADNAKVLIGTQSLKISPVTAAIGPSWRGTAIPAAISDAVLQGYFWWPGTAAAPAANWQLVKAFSDAAETSTAQAWSVLITPASRIAVCDNTGAVVLSPTTVLPTAAQWLRVDVEAVAGTSIFATISAAHSVTALVTVPLQSTTAIGQVLSLRYGVHSSNTGVTSWFCGWRLGIGPGLWALQTSNIRASVAAAISGSWTATGGTAAGCLADDSPTTQVRADAPAGATEEVSGFGLISPGPITFTVGGLTSGPLTSRVLQLFCGATLVKAKAAYNITDTNESVNTISLDASEVPLVNDWADLRVRTVDTQ